MSKSRIGLVLPSLVVFGGATAGLWNATEDPVRPRPKPLGDPRPVVAESTVERNGDSPAALLAGVLAARARGDRAWLARSLSSCAVVQPLTEAQLAVAWLRFEWPPAAAVWERIAAAGAGELEIEEGRARMRWGDGLQLEFVQDEEGWCIADR